MYFLASVQYLMQEQKIRINIVIWLLKDQGVSVGAQ